MTDQATDTIAITGVSSHIGSFMAQRFLAAGYAVIGHYRTANQATESLAEQGVSLFQGDFADARATQAVAEAMATQHGRLRALIHNASAFAPTSADPAEASQQFEQFYAVHMRAPYLLNQRLGGQIRGAHGQPGDIIHITDIYADNPASHYDIYCASKAGLQNLALSFAKRLAPEVKVNCIQPGPISFQDWVDDEQQQAMLNATPLQRAGRPDNIFQAVQALLANDYQTGAIVPVDGGRRLGT